jgi:hypothetical protein
MLILKKLSSTPNELFSHTLSGLKIGLTVGITIEFSTHGNDFGQLAQIFCTDKIASFKSKNKKRNLYKTAN